MKRGTALGRGRRLFEYRPQQGCQKRGDTRRKEENEKRVDLIGTFSWDLNWVYVFTQPANNSVQGAWPYSIHHTHDQVEGDEMSVPIATHFESLNESHLFLQTQWPVWAGVTQIPLGKERLSLTPDSLIVHTETLQSGTGFSMNCERRLGLYRQTLHSHEPCETTCACVYVC